MTDEAEETENDGVPTTQASTLDELAAHAVRLAEPLERAWSKALDDVITDEAHAELGAEWSAVFTRLTEEFKASDAALEAEGYDPRIHEPFISKETIDALGDPADAGGRWRRAQLAHVLAVEPLAKALGAVTEPSTVEANLTTGERRAWWESGAFALVRARAGLLQRLGRVSAAAQQALVGDTANVPSERDYLQSAYDRVELAGRSKSMGDPEACLMHLRHALLDLLRTRDPDASPEAVGQHFAAVPSLEDFRVPLALLDDVLSPSSPTYGDLPTASLLTQMMLTLVRQLVAHPPADLLTSERQE